MDKPTPHSMTHATNVNPNGTGSERPDKVCNVSTLTWSGPIIVVVPCCYVKSVKWWNAEWIWLVKYTTLARRRSNRIYSGSLIVPFIPKFDVLLKYHVSKNEGVSQSNKNLHSFLSTSIVTWCSCRNSQQQNTSLTHPHKHTTTHTTLSPFQSALRVTADDWSCWHITDTFQLRCHHKYQLNAHPLAREYEYIFVPLIQLLRYHSIHSRPLFALLIQSHHV